MRHHRVSCLFHYCSCKMAKRSGFCLREATTCVSQATASVPPSVFFVFVKSLVRSKAEMFLWNIMLLQSGDLNRMQNTSRGIISQRTDTRKCRGMHHKEDRYHRRDDRAMRYTSIDGTRTREKVINSK